MQRDKTLMTEPSIEAQEIGKQLARLAQEAEEAGLPMLAYLIRMAEIEARTKETSECR